MADMKLEAEIVFEPHVPSSLRRALEYAGDDGFVASMPQLLHARANADYDNIIWNTWFTSYSEESVVTTPQGNRVVVAIHGGGIFATPARYEQVYRASVDRSNAGGFTGQYAAKISQKEGREALEGRLPDGSEIPVYPYEEFKQGISNLPIRYGVILDFELASQPVVDKYLEAACANSGPVGSSSNMLAEALLAISNQLHWREYSTGHEDEPDIALFTRSYSPTTIIGDGGLLPSDKVSAGLSLQGRDVYYPPHAHHAEESYWIIGGDGDWKVDMKPWFAVQAGDSVYHESGARHAMQTNEQALLSLWLWTSYLDSEVVIVRD